MVKNLCIVDKLFMDVFSDDTGPKFKVFFYNVTQLLCNTFQLDLPKTYAYTPTCLAVTIDLFLGHYSSDTAKVIILT